MAELEQAIDSRLRNYAGLKALVGTRIYPLKLKQRATMPAVTYQRISGPRISAMGADPGVASPRVQIDCWGGTYASSKAVATQVRGALQRYRGTVAAVEILAVFIESDLDIFEPDAELYRVSTDYVFWHRE